MKNKLIDLNDHLFAQMERLGNEDLGGDELKSEIDRSKAMTGVAREIIDNARLAFDAQKALGDNLIKSTPAMIGLDKK
ncbi:MAG: hypothetical protein HUJ30_02760 [Gammaproteobacteria bacterium]|nr:hypothetical protein [Gammaproteobacteria bacterium]